MRETIILSILTMVIMLIIYALGKGGLELHWVVVLAFIAGYFVAQVLKGRGGDAG